MRKIKSELYNRIYQDKSLSRLELTLLFWLASKQNEYGYVNGIYYSDIAAELDCSVSGFYLTRDSLVKKNYIEWDKSDTADMDIKLYDNSFVFNGETVYENYIDIDIPIFKDKAFFKLKAGSIKLAMYIIKRVEAAGAVTLANTPSASGADTDKARKLWFNPVKMIKKFKEILSVKSRSINEYLEELKEWISYGRVQSEGTMYQVVTVLKKGIVKNNVSKHSYPEQEAYVQKVKMFCRRKKIENEEKHLKDTADLLKQYRNAEKAGGFNLSTLLMTAIENTCTEILNSYNVHKSLRNLIEYNCPGILAK